MCEETNNLYATLIKNPKNIRDVIRTGLNLLALDNPSKYEINGCIDCTNCHHETDGDYGEIDCGWHCSKFDNYGYLNSFPFKKIMPCFQVDDIWGNSFFFWHAYLCDFEDWDNEKQEFYSTSDFLTQELKSKVFQWYLKKERRKQGEHLWACQASCKKCSFRNEDCFSRSLRKEAK